MSYLPVFVEFYENVKSSINQGTFAKLTMAKTMGDTELKNIYVQLQILETGGYNFTFTSRYKTEEVVSFHTIDEAFMILSSTIKNPFLSALLFTTEMDLTFKVNKKNAGSLIESAPTFKNASAVMLEMVQRGMV